MGLRDWFRRNSTFFVLAVLLILVSALTYAIGDLLIERIVTVLFIDLVLVLALQVFMGNSGILSFAVAGFMGIGAYGSVLFSMTPAAKAAALPDLYPFLTGVQLPFLASVLIGGLLAALVAAVVSYPLMRLSDAAGVITIFSLLVITNVVLVHWSTVTNGPRTLFGVERYTYLGTAAVFAVLFLAVAWWFKESSVGLKLRASRDDAFAAAAVGINIVAMRYLAFILSAFMAGFAGALWAHFITSFSPYSFYLSTMFVFLAMLVIGGPMSVSGAVIGTVAVTVLREGLRSIENNVNMSRILPISLVGFTEVVMAILLVVILVLRPSGIMGGRELRWPAGLMGRLLGRKGAGAGLPGGGGGIRAGGSTAAGGRTEAGGRTKAEGPRADV
jgi:branched-chain amino acid transport system permease protein